MAAVLVAGLALGGLYGKLAPDRRAEAQAAVGGVADITR